MARGQMKMDGEGRMVTVAHDDDPGLPVVHLTIGDQEFVMTEHEARTLAGLLDAATDTGVPGLTDD